MFWLSYECFSIFHNAFLLKSAISSHNSCDRKSAWKKFTVKRCLLILDIHKATTIIGQWKAFYRQRIPEPSCARKETIDIDILVTSRNGYRKIMQLDLT